LTLREDGDYAIEEKAYQRYVSLVGPREISRSVGRERFLAGPGRRAVCQFEGSVWSLCATAHPAIWVRERTPSLLRICCT
jgi:hypothetical protein